jgi:DNA mismatch repair protein MutL
MGVIHVLPPETARLIAAGEVIDRPASALRELIDNAIDSGASELSIRIEEGGVGLIRVVDDGSGMDRADLELSILPHATSKIASADDLLTARSLGFRGEALASIAAAASLEIVTKDEASTSAHRLVSRPGSSLIVEACAGRRGSAVSVSGLFEDYPARRQFLKRPQAEASLCRQAFEDKALAHPSVGFRFESGQGKPIVLRPSSRIGRVAALYPELPGGLLHLVKFSGKGFEGELVLAGPAYSRPDKRMLQAFVNRRRVQEWGLLGAIDYAFAGYLPGGLHPFAFLFLEVDPALVDFNIHPAKKEVRFKDPEGPRRAMGAAVQAFLSELSRRDPAQVSPDPSSELELGLAPFEGPLESAFADSRSRSSAVQHTGSSPGSGAPWPMAGERDWAAYDELRERSSAGLVPAPPAPAPERGFRYLGSALGPFLVFELEGALWFLDQHAAHERMLFDELMGRPPESQELLMPEEIEVEDAEEDARIGEAARGLAEAGFRLEREGGAWLVAAAPPELAKGAAEAARELARGSGDALRAARAMAACRAAIKDGDSLDDAAAEELIARALRLPEPRCPHGRPIWSRITREQLYRLVRREV